MVQIVRTVEQFKLLNERGLLVLCLGFLTAEEITASTENKLIKKTVWSKAVTTVSATALQLCGDSICFWLRPAADKTALKRVADRATPMAPPVRAAVATMPEAEPTRSIGTEPRIALWFGELNSAQPSPEGRAAI